MEGVVCLFHITFFKLCQAINDSSRIPLEEIPHLSHKAKDRLLTKSNLNLKYQ